MTNANRYEDAIIIDSEKGKPVARVALNGINVAPGKTLSNSGAMRSFKLLEGKLRRHWYSGALLTLECNGQQATVRIAALPENVGQMGFIEFVR